jgi:hypothetical protein
VRGLIPQKATVDPLRPTNFSRVGGASFGGASDQLYVAIANKKTTPHDTTPLGVLHYNTTPSI